MMKQGRTQESQSNETMTHCALNCSFPKQGIAGLYAICSRLVAALWSLILQQNCRWRISKPLPPGGIFVKKTSTSKPLPKIAATVVCSKMSHNAEHPVYSSSLKILICTSLAIVRFFRPRSCMR